MMCDETDRRRGSDASGRSERTGANRTTVRHDWQLSDQPSVVIVEAVAAATNRPVTELPLLQKTIDTDALDAILKNKAPSVSISFRYAGTTVWVDGEGSIEVHVDAELTAEDDA